MFWSRAAASDLDGASRRNRPRASSPLLSSDPSTPADIKLPALWHVLTGLHTATAHKGTTLVCKRVFQSQRPGNSSSHGLPRSCRQVRARDAGVAVRMQGAHHTASATQSTPAWQLQQDTGCTATAVSLPPRAMPPSSTPIPSLITTTAAAARRYFKVSERGSTLATEVKSGVVTFLTMSYILLVNPQILGAAGGFILHF